MPKEYTHWSIADNVLSKLDDSVRAKIKSHINIYLLGAVFHDALYYYTGDNQAVFEFADALHGSKGEDTHEPIRQLMSQNDRNIDQNLVLSLCAGMLTHISVDNFFHPFIYYYTGDYYSKNAHQRKQAQFRHRQLESAIDIKFGALEKRFNFNLMVEEAQASLNHIFENTLTLFNRITIHRDDISNALNNYKLARRFYANKALSGLLRTLKPVLPQSLKTVEELSYYNISWSPSEDLGNHFAYSHPVSGEHIETSILELEQHAITHARKSLTELVRDRTIKSRGLSLETGLPNSSVDSMKCFHESLL